MRRRKVMVKQISQTYCTIRIARFPQTHRTHCEFSKTTSTRMSDLGRINRDRRPCEYIKTRHPLATDIKACCVPQRWRQLPFVNQSWVVSFQQNHGIGLRQTHIGSPIRWVVHINHTFCHLFGCRSFSTPFWTLNKHHACSLQLVAKQNICNSFPIFFHKNLR